MKIYFPHEKIREEQHFFVKEVISAIKEKKILLAHAPTGLGKTVSTLAPALSYAKTNNKKVFFLTPKISQHEIVLETAKLMNEKFGLNIKTIDLVGKRGMCVDPFLSNTNYAVGFYEACNKKKKDKLCKYYTNTKGYTQKQKIEATKNKRRIINNYNQSYSEMKKNCFIQELCPYEVTLEMVKNADLVICDYSHIFHEEIREGILNSNNSNIKLEEIILIIDEAHNLPERIRDMYSTRIDLYSIEQGIKEAKNIGDFEVEEILKELSKKIIELGKKLSLYNSEAKLREEEISFLKKIEGVELLKIEEAAEKFMQKHKTENSFLASIIEFIYALLKQKQHTLYMVERKSSLAIGVYPLEIISYSKKVFSKIYSSTLMSGTLLPLEMYAEVLGINNLEKNFLIKEYKNPFNKKNRLNLIVETITTKYTQRTTQEYQKIAEYIDKIVNKVPKNTIVFFPSFELMNSISNFLKTKRNIIKQEREMNQEQKTKLIQNFKLMGSGFGGVMLAVSGGSIAEGVDFPGEDLSCAIIVGMPYTKMDAYTNSLIDYHQTKFGKGWEYAYNAPAISKAIQAAGRVIRSEEDKGICVFMDSRFGEERFRKYYPKDFEYKKTITPEKEVEEFFK